MKRFSLILFAGLLISGAASATERAARIEVGGLTCPSCPYIAAEAVESVESVTIIEGEYDPAAAKIVFLVSYDDAVTSPETVAAAPKQYGYPGRVLEAIPGS